MLKLGELDLRFRFGPVLVLPPVSRFGLQFYSFYTESLTRTWSEHNPRTEKTQGAD